MSQDPATGTWHLDKRINVAMVFAIVLQSFAVGVWVSSIAERVAALERWKDDSKEMAADIAVVKNQITDIKKTLERIDDRLTDNRRRP